MYPILSEWFSVVAETYDSNIVVSLYHVFVLHFPINIPISFDLLWGRVRMLVHVSDQFLSLGHITY